MNFDVLITILSPTLHILDKWNDISHAYDYECSYLWMDIKPTYIVICILVDIYTTIMTTKISHKS